MSIIKKIQEIIRPAPPTGNPYNFSDGKLKRLKSLRTNATWSDYQDLLDEVCKMYAEQLLTTSTDADVHFLRGMVTAMRRAGTLIDEIQLQEQSRGTDDIRAKLEQRADERRKLALFGSTFWSQR